MERGDDPASGDPEILKGVLTMYENEPEVRARAGIDPRMFEYIGQALR